MKRRLLWKLCLILATGLVSFFYLIHIFTLKTEESMSFIAEQDRAQLKAWAAKAESLYDAGKLQELESWLLKLKEQEHTYAAIAGFKALHIAGDEIDKHIVGAYHFGRSIEWKIHLYFAENPVMELPFSKGKMSFLIKLPERMRPGSHWTTTKFALQILVPMLVLAILSFTIYFHIITPLQKLKRATTEFSRGNFSVRVAKHLGRRNDELADLAKTFDKMAIRIGELISAQRQLIGDLSHELRTPLTRLDITVSNFELENAEVYLKRINRESKHIRKLVEDSLTLAWLDNEKPILQQESVDLVDLLDVLLDDARYEFPEHNIIFTSEDSAVVCNTCHRALAPAIENIIRNALRYTPIGKTVSVTLINESNYFFINVCDQGPGIPSQYLEKVFEPFFRVDQARIAEGDSFGLGLALAKRHLESVRASVKLQNNAKLGLTAVIMIPIY